MKHHSLSALLSLAAIAATAGPDLDMVMGQTTFRDAVRAQNNSALHDELIGERQARTTAQAGPGFGMELRPGVSDDDASLALRILLPDRWNEENLRKQLALTTQSEELRLKALEWNDIISVYSDFCTYRMLKQQDALIEKEIRFMEPFLKKADESVALNRFSVSDRARLYADHLAMLTEHTRIAESLLDIRQRLKMIMGAQTDIERLSKIAKIDMPSQLEIQSLLLTALKQRADYQQMGIQLQSLLLEEETAKNRDGFQFKYIQPEYHVNHEDGSTGWELSAAFVLPWGRRNPDTEIFQQRRILTEAARTQQRILIEHRLQVMLDTANAYYALAADQNHSTGPVTKQLTADLEMLVDVPLEQVRDVIAIRKQLLDADLQAARLQCRKESIAVDLAEELGGW